MVKIYLETFYKENLKKLNANLKKLNNKLNVYIRKPKLG